MQNLVYLSHLKSKSEFNLEAASILIDRENNFAPSVHCSYYGCFQYIKSKLNKLGHTYQMMDMEISSSRQGGGVKILHSNQYPLDLIIERVGDKTNKIYKKEVKDKIKLLKTYRVQSDYHNALVDDKKSRIALALSKEIIKLIDKKI